MLSAGQWGDGGAESRSYLWLPLAAWTLVVAASLGMNIIQEHRSLLETARLSARINYEKDILYRRWNALHGGVYAPVTKDNPPNPLLAHLPERDGATAGGKQLTLIIPAQMTRQVYALANMDGDIRGSIVSLKPFNPQRTPDDWEARSLKELEQGAREVSGVETLKGKTYLRLMRPLLVEQGCLNCHQDYKLGDVRGGLSVAVPLEPLWEAGRPHRLAMWGGHLFLWLLGSGGIIFGYLRLKDNLRFRREAEVAMVDANEKLKVMVYESSLRHRQAVLLNDMTELLQSCLTMEEAHRALGHFLPRLFPEESGALYLFRESPNFLEAVAVWGSDPPTETLFEPPDCLALRRGRLHQVADHSRGLVCAHLNQARASYLCVPLAAQGETLGVLHLRAEAWEIGMGGAGEEEGLPEMTRQLAGLTGEQLSLAISNLKLRESLAQQAIRDPLTGLFNRRYLDETFPREVHRVKRKGASLGVLMLDLDHFKRFNDTFGHKAGDVLLSAVGNFLKSRIRREDLPCRYGGEEFVLILPEISLEDLCLRAEELRRGMEELQVFHQGQYLGEVTVSLGAALYPSHGDTPDALLRAADAALYQAKQEGRNRLALAGLAPSPEPSAAPTPAPAAPAQAQEPSPEADF